MAHEQKIGAACLLTGLVCGCLLTIGFWPHDRERALKADIAAAGSASSATSSAATLSNNLETGLIKDATKTAKAANAAHAHWHAVTPPAAKPTGDCGPSAYVIAPGLTPDDVWRAYSAGRNSVFVGSGSDHSETGVHSPVSANFLPAGTSGPEPAF